MRQNTVAAETLSFIRVHPGRTDAEINRDLYKGAKNHAQINIVCRQLEMQGLIERRKRGTGPIKNYPTAAAQATAEPSPEASRQDIESKVQAFIGEAKDQYHRYLSWDHCYAFFKRRTKIRTNPHLRDHAALHLSWFLASWGMLRGSGDLFWKNYKFCIPVVDAVTLPEYDNLLGFDPVQRPTAELLEGIFGERGLRTAIGRAFTHHDPKLQASDILITKTILGTLACSMAYDQYVQKGLKECGLTVKFGARSLSAACDFYRAHKDQFEPAANCCPPGYPPFKLLDMFFFQLGFE